MENSASLRAGSSGATSPDKAQLTLKANPLLTTKEVATLTGFSTSYFEKGRIYAYGPKFLRVNGAGRNGKILYRRADVEAWLASQECDPEVMRNV